jgi:hypothetical protein
VEHVSPHRAAGHHSRSAVRRWSGVVVVVVVVGSALGAEALAVAASPLRLGSAAASRTPSPAEVKVRGSQPARRSAGTVMRLGGPVVASTGPAPARADLRKSRARGPRGVARDIARHLAAGNTEVARYVIPFEVLRATGCRVGFMTATVDPAEEEAVHGEKQGRGSRLAQARGSLGRDAVAHAAQPTAGGLKVHVIVAQLCPVRGGT